MEEKVYLHRPEEVAIFPGVAGALRQLRNAGFKLFIVSNQAGVGRGYFTLDDVAKVNERLTGELAREGALCIAVTHDLNLALTHCSRVLILDQGKLAADCVTDDKPEP